MSTVNHRKLLLIACSNRKVRTPGLLPALERYDGVTYRVIRKARREGYFPENVDIKILSAEFGLIDGATPIPYYDRRMDRKRAEELSDQVQRDLGSCLAHGHYHEVYVELGRDYSPAIDGFVFPAGCKIVFGQGRIGERLRKLKRWVRSCEEGLYMT